MPRKKIPWLTLLTLLLSGALILPTRSVWVTDVGIKSIFSQSLLRNKFNSLAIPYPGRFLDPPLNFTPLRPPEFIVKDGQIHTIVNFLYPMVNAFLISLLGFRGIYLLSYLSLVLIYIFSYLTLRDVFQDKTPALGALLICIGTSLLFYGFSGWEYNLAGVFALLSFYFFSLGEKKQQQIWHFWSGAALGASVWWREELYVLIFVSFLTCLIQRRNGKTVFLNLLGVFLSLIPLWFAQSIMEGGFLGRPLQAYLMKKGGPDIGVSLFLKFRIFYGWLFSAQENQPLNFVLAVLIILPVLLSFSQLKQKWLNFSWFAAILGLMTYCFFLLINPNQFYNTQFTNGLFFSSPLLLFAFLKVKHHTPDLDPDNLAKHLLLANLLFVIFIAWAANPNSGRGMHIGARHLIPVYPLLGLLAWLKISELCQSARQAGDRVMPVTVALVLILSVGLQGYSVALLARKKIFSQKIIKAITADQSPNIITSVWWLPVEMSSVFFQENFFYIDNLAKMELLVKRIARRKREDFLYITSPNYANSIPNSYLRDKWRVEITARKTFAAPRLNLLKLTLVNFHFKDTNG